MRDLQHGLRPPLRGLQELARRVQVREWPLGSQRALVRPQALERGLQRLQDALRPCQSSSTRHRPRRHRLLRPLT